MVNLKDTLTTPDKKWFRYRQDDDLGLVLMDPGEKGKELFALEVEYVSPKDYREMLTANVTRRAIAKRGAKALVSGGDKAKVAICLSQVTDWRLTMAGCYALELTGDLSQYDPTLSIEFNAENLELMAKHSELGNIVHSIIDTHANWFSAPPGDDDDDREKSAEELEEDSPGN